MVEWDLSLINTFVRHDVSFSSWLRIEDSSQTFSGGHRLEDHEHVLMITTLWFSINLFMTFIPIRLVKQIYLTTVSVLEFLQLLNPPVSLQIMNNQYPIFFSPLITDINFNRLNDDSMFIINR
jgi:hypothetical protein